MRAILMGAFLGLLSLNASALDQKEVTSRVEAIRAKEMAGQNVKQDVIDLSKELEASTQSIVVTHTTSTSIVDKEGKVLYTLAGKPHTSVISNANVQINDGVATLSGGKSKEQSSSGPLDLIKSIVGAGVGIAGEAVSSFVGGIVGGII